MNFDGARAFGKFGSVMLVAALLAVPYIGFWFFIPAGISAYFALIFFNRLEARDLRDEKRRRQGR